MRRRSFLRSVGAVGTVSACAATSTAAAGRGADRDGGSLSPSSVSLTGALEAVVGDDGTTVYVAAHDGFGVVDASDFANPEVVAERRDLLADRELGPLREIYDVSVSGDRLLVAGPRSGLYNEELGGFLLYDVSDPANPEQVAFFETDHGIHNAFLDGDTAYLTGTGLETEPLVVADVAGDRPEEVARWSVVDENEAWADVESYVRSCHDVYVQDGTAYVAYWDAGTWLLDVSDPANPTPDLQLGGRNPAAVRNVDNKAVIETYELPGNSHYVAPNEDGSLVAVGREAWDNGETDRTGGPGGITLWDVADRSSPERLVRLAPPTFPDRSESLNRTSHNFAFRGDRLYTSWYGGGVKVYDVSSPTEPTLLAAWAKPDEATFWTAQPADGGFVASSRFNPTKHEQLSRKEKRKPAESAKLFTFSEPAGENPRPARTEPAPVRPSETTGTATTAGGTTTGTEETSTTETTATTGTTTDEPTASTDEPTASTAETTGVGTPGFGVGTALVGGGLALARLLRERS
ncbi:LVIVD repeat-containing protein [Halorussus sp. AFM4]|uniref:LVIVD repeat-containing protein n=1 Tax=Halorussus sp. AFM4 TaxID=3421651 RepID=UPI003EBD7A82